ncbi:hypothetical protein KI387_018394 [Taxus chinensis]|uniref:RING-type E3 ubiquitin transferase n=1 Tax=Taxus chinensis TaxID=29808 RepID=A0AA38GKZ9_TAXCH|nr:hypothetical protein KI387_018394 [Taxus chinensis]
MEETANSSSPAETAKWAKTMNKNLCRLAKVAEEVCPKKEHVVNRILLQFGGFLRNLAQVMKELQKDLEIMPVEYTALEMDHLEAEVKKTETLLHDIFGRSSLYLLTCCSTLIDQVKNCAKKSGVFLENVILEGSSDALKFHVSEAKQLIEKGMPKLESKDHILCNSFEDGALDSIVSDYSLSSNLAEQIADSLRIPLDGDAFSTELAKLKVERTEAVELRGKVHSLYLEQFIVLLEKAITSKRKPVRIDSYDKVDSSHGRSNTHRDIPMLPLQSFICPITKDVMRDPVQIASGQTYERAAIERWFDEGHTRCPTGVELKNCKMKPNFALKQSIAEWRERNYNIRLENANELLNNLEENEEEQLKAVQDLQALCEEDSLNKYKVANKNLIPRLVKLTKSSSKLAAKAFSTLAILAKDNTENQGIMAENGIIDLIVHCLARQKEEAPQSVYLMRLLSENQDIAEKIGHARNAVLFLVTLIQEEEFAENVGSILENLPKSDNDVITMAEANIMNPLVSRLIEGEYASQILMAKTLGRLHMPDSSKEIVATTETISTLIEMMNNDNTENHEGCLAAINALESLSSVSSISRKLENVGGIQILVKQLNSVKSSETVKTGAAHVLANIFSATVEDYAGKSDREAELEELIVMFLSLMGPITAPDVHYYILQGMIGLANGNKISITAKTKMKERDAFNLLINLWMTVTDQRVKERAVELFSFLSRTFGGDACSALNNQQGSLNIILDMLKEGYAESDHAVAASILADLPPEDNQILESLLHANIMPRLVKLLENVNDIVVEASVGALLRFCLKKEHQPKLAEMKVIQKMVSLLSAGRSLTKEWAARALYHFSKSTPSLSKIPVPPSCWSCFSSRPVVCKLHRGVCSIEDTNCLLEAGAVKPLVQVLKEQKMSCVLAALRALTTLVGDDVRDSEFGYRLIAQENGDGVLAVIGLISSGTPEVQEICANLCEKFFSMAEYRNKYGIVAQMHIIGLAQKGSSTQRQTAGRILRQLELLHSQSHYFAVSAAGNP